MVKNLICTDCNVMMNIGFIPDLSYGAVIRSTWVEGKPEFNFLGTIKFNFRKRKNYYVTAYRCGQCGAIKLFAESDQPAYQ